MTSYHKISHLLTFQDVQLRYRPPEIQCTESLTRSLLPPCSSGLYPTFPFFLYLLTHHKWIPSTATHKQTGSCSTWPRPFYRSSYVHCAAKETRAPIRLNFRLETLRIWWVRRNCLGQRWEIVSQAPPSQREEGCGEAATIELSPRQKLPVACETIQWETGRCKQ